MLPLVEYGTSTSTQPHNILSKCWYFYVSRAETQLICRFTYLGANRLDDANSLGLRETETMYR